MARVSRKHTTQEVKPTTTRIYNVAMYIRLSVEDSGTNKSEVIELQRYMVEQFVNKQKDMQIFSTYCDNGYTGTNFDRPDFERMMVDIRSRKIDCIVVKDLSRFGRNYIETGYFLEKIFPFLGVRFVAINDNYDTLHNANGDEMVVSLKNIVNSIYAKDISKKVSTAIHQKQKNGEFIGAFAPYGYMKNPDNINQLIVNPVTSLVVKNIFKWKLEGIGYVMIARKLNEQGAVSPSMYKYLNGNPSNKKPTGNATLWQGQMVKAITKNFTYTGNLTQGKTLESLCGGISSVKIPKDNHIIVYDTHEPIIAVEAFHQLEQLSEEKVAKSNENNKKHPFVPNIFKDKIFCSDCGNKMIRYKGVSPKGAVRYIFICKQYEHNRSFSSCTKKLLGEPELMEVILSSIKVQVAVGFSLEESLNNLKDKSEYKKQQRKIATDLAKIENLLIKNATYHSSLFANYTDNVISLTDYNRMKIKYTQQVCELEEQKKNLLKAQILDKKILSPQNEWLKAFRKHQNTKVLNCEIITELIDRVVVSNYNDVEVVFNYADDLSLLKQFIVGGINK